MTGYTGETLLKAQRLRRELTDAERKLWSALRNRQVDGAKFRRQQPIGPFIADFVCQERRLIVEADGGQHGDCRKDVRRSSFLESQGYRVLRFWNNDILTNVEGVVATSLARFRSLTLPSLRLGPLPLPQGERGLET